MGAGMEAGGGAHPGTPPPEHAPPAGLALRPASSDPPPVTRLPGEGAEGGGNRHSCQPISDSGGSARPRLPVSFPEAPPLFVKASLTGAERVELSFWIGSSTDFESGVGSPARRAPHHVFYKQEGNRTTPDSFSASASFSPRRNSRSCARKRGDTLAHLPCVLPPLA